MSGGKSSSGVQAAPSRKNPSGLQGWNSHSTSPATQKPSMTASGSTAYASSRIFLIAYANIRQMLPGSEAQEVNADDKSVIMDDLQIGVMGMDANGARPAAKRPFPYVPSHSSCPYTTGRISRRPLEKSSASDMPASSCADATSTSFLQKAYRSLHCRKSSVCSVSSEASERSLFSMTYLK